MEEQAVSFREVLRRLREDAGLSQRALAQRAAMSEDAVSSLERGIRSPRAETVTRLAQALRVGKREREALLRAAGHGTGLLPPEATGLAILEDKPNAATLLAEARALIESMPTDTLPPHAFLPAGSRMRLRPNPLFVGRGEELLQVAAALKGADATVALGQVVASTGLGGLGKTQLAAEFVHRYGRFFAGGVFWLSFASADEIPLQIAGSAGPAFEARPMEERLELVQRAWQSSLPRLLVFDNCEDEELLEAWRPPSGGCRLLVTSRRSQWSPTLCVTALPLDLLPRPDSIELLRRYRPDLAPDDPGLDAIAKELGDLPLALHLAGSYLRAYQAEVSLDGYLAEIRRPDVIEHASLLGRGLEGTPNPTRHVQSVAHTFALCLGRLDREREVDRVAIALLARMAWMAPGEPVPRDVLAKTLKDVDPMLRADGIRRLAAVGLVEEGEGWLRLHRLLVQFVRQEGLDPMARPAVDRALIGCGNDAEEGHLAGSALAAVIPHLVDIADRDTDDEMRLAGLCHAAGQALQCAGDLRAARPWLERALAIRQRVLGSDDPLTAISLNELAVLLRQQGELGAARPLYERALDVRERVLGPAHPLTAESLNNLALMFWSQGELVVARPLYERALTIYEQVLGPYHPHTALALNNLAVLLWAQGELGAARPVYERALAVCERVRGLDHPDTARCLNNLAVLLQDLGELAAARPLHERALESRERVLGPCHPLTAASLNNLGRQLQAQGELAAARPLFERALAIRKQVLGEAHPDTAISVNSLALLLRNQGELVAARPLFERALAIRERVLGPNHTDTATTLHDLALLHQAQGDPAAARPLFERALAIRERVLGPDHTDTVATRHALAELAGGPPADC
jgi:tetratricopeptide (TPR) repeat protein/transcriptional regulator with XRE-family HTH domain